MAEAKKKTRQEDIPPPPKQTDFTFNLLDKVTKMEESQMEDHKR